MDWLALGGLCWTGLFTGGVTFSVLLGQRTSPSVPRLPETSVVLDALRAETGRVVRKWDQYESLRQEQRPPDE